MKVVFQFNDKILSYEDFQEKDIIEVEKYFYNPLSNGKNTFNKEYFNEYVEIMKLSGKKEGSQKQSDFQPTINIYMN